MIFQPMFSASSHAASLKDYQRLQQWMQMRPLPWSDFLGVFPELQAAASTPQDPTYHAEGDVWTHTKMVLESLIALDECASLSLEEQFIVFYAALLHDVAKAFTTQIDPDTGRIRHPHHSSKGSVMTRTLLWKLNIPFAIRESICALIRVHQVPFHLYHSPNEDTTRKLQGLSWRVSIRLLCLLAEADIRGRVVQGGIQSILEDIEYMRLHAQEEGCFSQERPYVDTHTRLMVARFQQGHPDYPMFAQPGSSVILMAGLPASGKSYWVQQYAAHLPEVSFDETRKALGLRYGQNEGKVIHSTVDQVKELLRQQASFVWNATHLSQSIRDKSLDLLYRYQAKVRLVYHEVPYTTLMRRNQARDTSLTQDRLESLLHRWELPMPDEVHQIEYWVGETKNAS